MIMAENPNWWSLNGSSSSSNHDHSQDFPLFSWTQLLPGGGASEDQRVINSNTSSDGIYAAEYMNKKMEKSYWADRNDHQTISFFNHTNRVNAANHDVKKEKFDLQRSQQQQQQQQHGDLSPSSCCASETTSTVSCSTTNNTNFLDFSSNHHFQYSPDHQRRLRDYTQHTVLHPYSSYQETSATSAASNKKARVQPSTTQQPPLKVRKEKLGDRITALHQLVSPFGKTDTASVLSEAIGYIRFLESQIQALSSPYLGKASAASMRIQQSVTVAPVVEEATKKDLRSRGLRLVPMDCIHQIHIIAAGNTDDDDSNIIMDGLPNFWPSSAQLGAPAGF